MIDCIIGSWQAILKISAHVTVGRASDITPPLGRLKYVSNVNVFCIADIVTFEPMILYFRFLSGGQLTGELLTGGLLSASTMSGAIRSERLNIVRLAMVR